MQPDDFENGYADVLLEDDDDRDFDYDKMINRFKKMFPA